MKEKPADRSLRQFWARVVKNRWFYVCLFPGFILMLLFNYLPLYGLLGAFQAYDPFEGFFASPWVGLDNFTQLFSLPDFGNVFWNTITIGFWTFVFGFPAPVILALLFNEILEPRFKKITQTISYIPNFISWVVASGIFYKFLATDGAVNDLLVAVGMGEPINFFGEPSWFVPIVVITSIWKGVGFSSILYLAVLTNIDPGLYEAADIDGAGKLKKIWCVTLPGMMPTIALVLVMNLSSLLNVNFDQVYTMQNSMNISVSDTMDTYMFRIAMQGQISDYSRGMAMGLFRAIICLFLFLTANGLSKKMGNGSVV